MNRLRLSNRLFVVCALMLVGLGRDFALSQVPPPGSSGPPGIADPADSSGLALARSRKPLGAADGAFEEPGASTKEERPGAIIASELKTDEYAEASVANLACVRGVLHRVSRNRVSKASDRRAGSCT